MNRLEKFTINVSSEGNHFEIPQDVTSPDIVDTEKKAHQEAALLRRVCQAPPNDIVTEDEDEMSENVSDASAFVLM